MSITTCLNIFTNTIQCEKEVGPLIEWIEAARLGGTDSKNASRPPTGNPALLTLVKLADQLASRTVHPARQPLPSELTPFACLCDCNKKEVTFYLGFLLFIASHSPSRWPAAVPLSPTLASSPLAPIVHAADQTLLPLFLARALAHCAGAHVAACSSFIPHVVAALGHDCWSYVWSALVQLLLRLMPDPTALLHLATALMRSADSRLHQVTAMAIEESSDSAATRGWLWSASLHVLGDYILRLRRSAATLHPLLPLDNAPSPVLDALDRVLTQEFDRLAKARDRPAIAAALAALGCLGTVEGPKPDRRRFVPAPALLVAATKAAIGSLAGAEGAGPAGHEVAKGAAHVLLVYAEYFTMEAYVTPVLTKSLRGSVLRHRPLLLPLTLVVHENDVSCFVSDGTVSSHSLVAFGPLFEEPLTAAVLAAYPPATISTEFRRTIPDALCTAAVAVQRAVDGDSQSVGAGIFAILGDALLSVLTDDEADRVPVTPRYLRRGLQALVEATVSVAAATTDAASRTKVLNAMPPFSRALIDLPADAPPAIRDPLLFGALLRDSVLLQQSLRCRATGSEDVANALEGAVLLAHSSAFPAAALWAALQRTSANVFTLELLRLGAELRFEEVFEALAMMPYVERPPPASTKTLFATLEHLTGAEDDEDLRALLLACWRACLRERRQADYLASRAIAGAMASGDENDEGWGAPLLAQTAVDAREVWFVRTVMTHAALTRNEGAAALVHELFCEDPELLTLSLTVRSSERTAGPWPLDDFVWLVKAIPSLQTASNVVPELLSAPQPAQRVLGVQLAATVAAECPTAYAYRVLLYALASLSLLQHQVESLRIRAEAETEAKLQGVYAIPSLDTPMAHIMVDRPPGFFAVWQRVRVSGVLSLVVDRFPMLGADVAQIYEVANALAPPEEPNVVPSLTFHTIYVGEVFHPPAVPEIAEHRRLKVPRVKQEGEEMDE